MKELITAPAMPEMMTAAQTAQLANIARSTMWALISRGRFPQPIRIGDRVRRWNRSTVLRWLEDGAPPIDRWHVGKRA